MLAIVQEMLPDANINSLQLNRTVQGAPHRGARNSSLQSFILAVGEYEGGDLALLPAVPELPGASWGFSKPLRVFKVWGRLWALKGALGRSWSPMGCQWGHIRAFMIMSV